MPDDVDQGSWRDALEQSWAKVSSEPAESTPAPAAEAAPEPAQAPVPDATSGPVRDGQGRFTAKPAESEKPPAPPVKPDPAIKPAGDPSGAQAAGGPPAPAAEPVLKAPQSWTPEEREAFAKTPPAAQRAALRREAEITRALNETAEPRKLREAVAPYEHIFRQSGLSTPQAVGNVLQKYAALSTATPQVRAQIIGELTRSFLGTDESAINLLAAAIDGRPGPAQQAQPSFGPEQIQSIVQQQLQAERQQVQREHAATLAEQFKASQPEHLEAVAQDMIDNLSAWERRNPGVQATMETFQQAYEKACRNNDIVFAIEQQKKEAQQAANANASTQKARASAVSVKSTPVGPAAPAAPGDDWRSHLEASWDRASGKQ